MKCLPCVFSVYYPGKTAKTVQYFLSSIATQYDGEMCGRLKIDHVTTNNL